MPARAPVASELPVATGPIMTTPFFFTVASAPLTSTRMKSPTAGEVVTTPSSLNWPSVSWKIPLRSILNSTPIRLLGLPQTAGKQAVVAVGNAHHRRPHIMNPQSGETYAAPRKAVLKMAIFPPPMATSVGMPFPPPLHDKSPFGA